MSLASSEAGSNTMTIHLSNNFNEFDVNAQGLLL